jgi:hypothetical protein
VREIAVSGICALHYLYGCALHLGKAGRKSLCNISGEENELKRVTW